MQRTLAAVNLYHPVHNSNTPIEVLIVSAIFVAFILAVVGAATFARRRELRGEQAHQEPEEAGTAAPH